MSVNAYSRTWFELFLETRPTTGQEVAFLLRQLPNPPYTQLLDLCCGQGRHTNRLARLGYTMTGLDLDAQALAIAGREAPAGAAYVCQDMRRLERLPGCFDAVLCLWQSFGYFDAQTNAAVLQSVRRKLRPRGRFILDIYHRLYWQARQGEFTVERKGITIRTKNRMQGPRLQVELAYEPGTGRDSFEWQLYTPEEICALAEDAGLRCLLVCTEYDEQNPAVGDKPLMQLVFERG